MVAAAHVATGELADMAAAVHTGSVERTDLAEDMAEQRVQAASGDLQQPTPKTSVMRAIHSFGAPLKLYLMDRSRNAIK
jgi:hypothetical protein